MSDSLIKTGKVELMYFIYKYEGDSFDWRLSNGDESDELFETAEKAERDVRSRYS